MDYDTLSNAHADWIATSPDPATDDAFLAWGNESRTELVPDTLANERTFAFAVTEATGDPAAAEAAIQGIEVAAESNAVIARALRWISPDNGGVDVGNSIVRAMLDQLAAGGAITQTAADAIKAVGERTTTRFAANYGLAVVGQPHLDRLRLDGRIA